MSEKRLSFIIDPTKAKSGAEQIKQSLESIQSAADKLQRTFTSFNIGGVFGGSGGSSTGVDATARAMRNAANSTQFWEQRLKDLDTAQYKHLVQIRETARQVEAYQKSLVQALSPAQQLAKAENELRKQYQSSKVQTALYEKGLAQKNVKQRESIALQKQLAQSQARLAQTYTKEYAELIRNNAAIQKRRRELLGLDDAQKKVGISADKLRSAALAIGGAFGAYSLGHIAAEAVRMADAYTGVQNRLAVVAGATTDLTQATRELLDVSIRSRTALDTTMDVYAKMIRVTKDMSFQNKDLLRITESVSKAVAMSGASAQGAEGALLQFSQALSGNFQASAQELNSIIEQTPAVAQLMADALNKVDPQINATLGNLKKLATEGRFSTEMLLEGILLMSDGIDEQFGRATRTVSQSLQALRDSVMVTFGEIDRAFGGTGSLAESITNIAESLGEFKAELAGAGAAVAAFIGTTAGLGLAALVPSLGTVASAILAVGSVIGGITYLFVKNKTESALLKAEVDELTKSNKLLAESYDAIADSYNTLPAAQIGEKMSEMSARVAETSRKLEEAQKKLDMLRVRDIYDRTNVESQIKIVQQLQKEYDLHQKQLERLRQAGIRAFGDDVIGGIKEYVREMLGLNEEENKRVKTAGDVISSLNSEIRAEEMANRQRAEATLLMRAYALAKEQGVEVTTDFVKKILAEGELIESLQKGFKRSSTVTRDWKSDLDSLRKSLDPAYAALRDKQDAMEILNKTVSQSDPLYRKLADAIDQRYTKAVQDATSASKEFATPMQTIRNELLGTQSAYDTYNQMVTKIINAQGDQVEKTRLVQIAYAKLQEELSKSYEIQDAPSVGVDPFSGFSNIGSLIDKSNELQDWFDTQLEIIDTNRAIMSEKTREWDLMEQELHRQHIEALNAIDQSRQQMQLQSAETVAGNLTQIASTAFGEQSGIYKALFLVQKGIAFASTIINTNAAAAAALAPPPIGAGPIAGIPVAAMIKAQGYTSAALIAAQAISGMAHDGIDSIPQTGTWLLEKGERVTTAKTSAKLDRTLSRIESNMDEGYSRRSGKGGAVVNQTINVTGTIDNRTSSQIARETSRRQRVAETRFGK